MVCLLEVWSETSVELFEASHCGKEIVEMRQDFEKLGEGQRVRLFPLARNPLHKKPVGAVYYAGYLYCDGSPVEDGPDYYLGDVLRYCEGFELE